MLTTATSYYPPEVGKFRKKLVKLFKFNGLRLSHLPGNGRETPGKAGKRES
jgi:hypothetical protein